MKPPGSQLQRGGAKDRGERRGWSWETAVAGDGRSSSWTTDLECSNEVGRGDWPIMLYRPKRQRSVKMREKCKCKNPQKHASTAYICIQIYEKPKCTRTVKEMR